MNASLVQSLGLLAACPSLVLAAPSLIVAHRGANMWAPENTIPAITQAFQLQAEVVEIDVYTSADGIPVVIHDPTVDRTTNGTGEVHALTLAELKAFDAGSWGPWAGSAFAGTRIPTLVEAMNAAAGAGRLQLDIKEVTPAAVKAALDASTLSESDLQILAWSLGDVSAFATMLPRAEVLSAGWSQPATSEAAFQDVLARGAKGFALYYPTTAPSFIDAALAHGLKTFFFVVNDPAVGQDLIDAGAEGLTTDAADAMRANLDFDPSLQVRQMEWMVPGEVRLTWRALIGHTYHIEFSTNLKPDNWNPVPGVGGLSDSILPTANFTVDRQLSSGFFRVVEVE